MDFKKIQDKWQKKWANAKLYRPKIDPSKKKFYIQVAYPYPSGAMHIGHARTYTFPDIIARYKRMQGYNVLLPMGWHVTGTPVIAQTELIKKRDPKVTKIMKNICKIPEKDFQSLHEKILASRS